jgi:hypothetical protein
MIICILPYNQWEDRKKFTRNNLKIRTPKELTRK